MDAVYMDIIYDLGNFPYIIFNFILSNVEIWQTMLDKWQSNSIICLLLSIAKYAYLNLGLRFLPMLHSHYSY
jgi:hypothetical protein